jgi:dephospho-CoA kinase
MIKRASQHVVVIEAIKLLEGKMAAACDAIWVTVATEDLQKSRLLRKRGLSAEDALQRIRAQGPQEAKAKAAKVVIKNAGSFEDTWKQVLAGWQAVSPKAGTGPVVMHKGAEGELEVQRGRPRDSEGIASLITRLSGGARQLSAEDIMAAFGEKAFLLLMSDRQLVGLAGLQVENLVARTVDLYLDPAISTEKGIKVLVTEVEQASQDLQCEASLFFLPPQMAGQEGIWKELGYARRAPQALGVQAWQDAALESQPPDTILLFKQLRQDRVLRPI